MIKLIPYLNFDGNTEEAMNFYTKVFNGNLYMVSRFGDTNPACAPEEKDRIMHARLSFGDDNVLMFSDSMHGKSVNFGDSISLSIALTDEAEAYSVFNQLADGGLVMVPMAKQFWGDIFGMAADKYGIQWMINCVAGK